jgi:hypothetical protein
MFFNVLSRNERGGSFQPGLHGYAASVEFAQRQHKNVDFVSFFSAHPIEK